MKKFIFFLLCFYMIFLSCTLDKEEAHMLMVEKYIESRLERNRSFNLERCRDKLEKEVLEVVEKDLKRRGKEFVVEDENILIRPQKPQKPTLKEAQDSLIIAPLVKDSFLLFPHLRDSVH